MARQSSVGWAFGWLVSAVIWSCIEKKLWFPGPFSKQKMKCACTLRWGAPATFSESTELSCACPNSVVKSSLSQLDMCSSEHKCFAEHKNNHSMTIEAKYVPNLAYHEKWTASQVEWQVRKTVLACCRIGKNFHNSHPKHYVTNWAVHPPPPPPPYMQMNKYTW